MTVGGTFLCALNCKQQNKGYARHQRAYNIYLDLELSNITYVHYQQTEDVFKLLQMDKFLIFKPKHKQKLNKLNTQQLINSVHRLDIRVGRNCMVFHLVSNFSNAL